MGNAVSLNVTIFARPNTSNIFGNPTTCANTNGVPYNVNFTSGSSYAWTIVGGTQAGGGTTNSIIVNWGAAGAGNINVVETVMGMCVGTPVNLPVTINTSPSTSSITGIPTTFANTNGPAYSVTN